MSQKMAKFQIMEHGKYNTAKYIVLLVYLYRTHIKYKGLPVTGFFGSK